jgi:hypothetical protein
MGIEAVLSWKNFALWHACKTASAGTYGDLILQNNLFSSNGKDGADISYSGNYPSSATIEGNEFSANVESGARFSECCRNWKRALNLAANFPMNGRSGTIFRT